MALLLYQYYLCLLTLCMELMISVNAGMFVLFMLNFSFAISGSFKLFLHWVLLNSIAGTVVLKHY